MVFLHADPTTAGKLARNIQRERGGKRAKMGCFGSIRGHIKGWQEVGTLAVLKERKKRAKAKKEGGKRIFFLSFKRGCRECQSEGELIELCLGVKERLWVAIL